MPVNIEAYHTIRKELDAKKITLVAVSKTKSPEAILELYRAGHRDFGENYVQELKDKAATLPGDIRWHFIGHLQSNKVKFIAPFVQLIHGADSLKLLQEINKQAEKNQRVIDCLLQVHIAEEETKFGFDKNELGEILKELERNPLAHARVVGLMGMASFTPDPTKIRNEFRVLRALFDQQPSFRILSMGMSADYGIAAEEGSTMVRIGSILFGERAGIK